MKDLRITKLPRLYLDRALTSGQALTLQDAHAHYVRDVLRRRVGDGVRLFNGRDGEYLATLQTVDKKTVTLIPERQLTPQPPPPSPLHLLFAPIKKTRMDFLIEKAVELGATHVHPVLTGNTETRALNTPRMNTQIAEAAEQCERLDLPVCTELERLDTYLAAWPKEIPILACIERADAALLQDVAPQKGPCAVLIGPEGGFTADEIQRLAALPFIIPASLGPRILRSETAACAALAILTLTHR